jgi:nitrogenase molybdenum-iron protein alpha/beta subunit
VINEACKIISVYSADTSGVCSALYELGGMTVIHDASGCNSSYTTHDEPRWYDMQSMVYVSGLTEYEAVLGDEEKFINDCVTTACEQHPKFIAVCTTPIPFMVGMDLMAICKDIERKSNIPTLCVETNGMHSYISGAASSLCEWAKRFVKPKTETIENTINILGCIPLDYENQEIVDDMVSCLEDGGLKVTSVWAMGDKIDGMQDSSSAMANLVVSSTGLETAKYMEKQFGIPYVVGSPMGQQQTNEIIQHLKAKKTITVRRENHGGKIAIIGEPVYSNAVAKLIQEDCTIYSLIRDEANVLCNEDKILLGEEDLENHLKAFDTVIGDGLFKHLVSSTTNFVNLPDFAFSGRIYINKFPSLLGKKGDEWVSEEIK